MVLSEVARDPPSPFLTVQAGCEGVLLPAVTPPAAGALASPFTAAQCSGSSSSSSDARLRQQQQVQQQHVPCNTPVSRSASGSFNWRAGDGDGPGRSHLQSIVSQQSLNFNVAPPDSPLEFELALNSIAAAEQAKLHHPQLGVARGSGSFSAGGGAAAQDSRKHRGLRLLPGRSGWLRSSRSLPQCSSRHKDAAPQPCGVQGGTAMPHTPCSLPREQELQQAHQQLSSKLKTRVHKLLSWAGGRQPSPGRGSCAATPPQLSDGGGVVIVDAASVASSNSQQQQQVPVPWQHQLFSDPPAQLINTTSVPAQVLMMRSPRMSLVSSPSSCDCPALHGRYSSAGSDSNYGASPLGAPAVGSLFTSVSCSVASSPSPCKLPGDAAARELSLGGTPPLLVTTSVRPPHQRHRQHRPGCRFYHGSEQHPQLQRQQQSLSHGGTPRQQQSLSHGGTPLSPHQQQQHMGHLVQQPMSPSSGLLQPQGSLRTALQQLESMASLKAARIMDKLNAGLLKMTSQRVFDGMSLKCVIGKEVLRDWEFGPHLGMGSSCVMRLVTERNSGRPAACKSISKQGIMRSAAVKAALLGVQREVAILQASLGHPHVVQLQAVYEDVHNLHMILEWCVGGSLFSLMERCNGYCLPEAAAAAATKATLEVLAHCHARGVMHRDIKPDNLLVAEPLEDPNQLTADIIKVSDFGISLPVTAGAPLDELAGTPGYMAPEVLQRCYDQQADVWSTGVMLYEMITGRLPFPGGNTFEEYLLGIQDTQLDLSCPEWLAVSEQARQLVAAMLTKDPKLRPTAHKLLQHYSAWLNTSCGQKNETQHKDPQQA